jgi:peptide-methionine (R)-S-oxide reductase
MDRRQFFLGTAGAVAGLVVGEWFGLSSVGSAKESAPDGTVKIVQFDDAGKNLGQAFVPKVRKTDGEWRQQLSPLQYQVTRKEGTEVAYTGEYANLHEKGLFRCICCGNALFSSETKYDSGTGWPSFWAPIAKENVRSITDLTLGMARTAVACTECEAHLGHVFEDGPRPTGLRYCMNSASLKFVKG